jgi:hypothetical protein
MKCLPMIALLLATACSSAAADRPDSAMIDKLERKLSPNPCIGSLARWSRSYSFERDPESRRVVRRIVTFLYEEAGKFEFKAGRHIFAPGEVPINLDDRQYMIAFGTYDLQSDKIEVGACGPNVGGP